MYVKKGFSELVMNDVDAAIRWYRKNRSLYRSLASKVESIVKENLEQSKVQYHSVTSRGKSLKSFTDKAKSGKYADPINEIKDMAGVRVITYLESDVRKVADVIERLFDIDKAHSLDQSQLLGSDRLGYRSVHYVAKFDKTRCKLPEYEIYKNLPFEIQIRSILQHAWAEIEHDRNYKFSGKLPTELERRFYLVAGMLEYADREFVAIAEEIDKYKAGITEELGKGDLDIEINTASLKEYLSNKFSKLIEDGLLATEFGKDDESAKLIVEEVQLFGISKLYQLDNIIPEDLQDSIRSILKLKLHPKLDFTSITRIILIINDAKRYFEVSWRNNWHFTKKSHIKLMNKYGVDVVYVRKRVGMNM